MARGKRESNVETLVGNEEVAEQDYNLVINVTDEWRIVKLDEYNFQIQQFRLPAETAFNKDKERVKRWFAAGYYPTIASGVEAVFHKMLATKEGTYTLQEFAAIVRDAKDTIAKALEFQT